MSEERSGGFYSGCKGFIWGSLVGVVVGLLVAPKPGKELRAELKAKTDELIEQGRESYFAQKEKLQEVLETGKQAAAQRSDELKEKIEETKEKVKKQVDRVTELAQKRVGAATKGKEEGEQ